MRDSSNPDFQIRDSYPEKNKHEAKVKKEYGNKAYQEGKDLDALFLYTQVSVVSQEFAISETSICIALSDQNYSSAAFYQR